MTDKNTLKQKLEETKAKIKSNSKDAHFAEMLISDLLSAKAELDHEPTISHIPVSSVIDSYKGDTFEISITKNGEAIYHVYGGYKLIVDPRMVGLYQTIEWLMDSYRGDSEKDDDDLEYIEAVRSATAFVLSAPTYAFSNDELVFKIAGDIVEYLGELQHKMMTTEVQEDDVKENIEFEDTMRIAHSDK